MADEIYQLNFYAQEQKSAIAYFPITVKRIPAGQQVEQGWHRHDSIELVIVTAGSGEHFLEGVGARVQTGDVLVVYPNQLHGYADCGTLGLVNLMYDTSKLPIPLLDGVDIPLFHQFLPENLTTIGKQSLPRPVLHLSSPDALAKTLTQIQELSEEISTRRPGNMLVSTVKFLDIILSLLRHADATAQAPPNDSVYLFGDILKFLNQNYMKKISLNTLVKRSWLSPRVFQTRFKELTGCCVSEYIARKRIALAQELLLNFPAKSIQDIAAESGFCDPSNFSCKFRRAIGMTPTDFRRQNRPRTP